MNRYRIIVGQKVPDDKLVREDRQDNPTGRYLYAAGDPQQALYRFHGEIPIACLEDFDVTIEPFEEDV